MSLFKEKEILTVAQAGYVYSIRDAIANTFAPPFLCPSDQVAVRSMKRSLGDQPFQEDYELFRLGVMDLITGKIESKVEKIEVNNG